MTGHLTARIALGMALGVLAGALLNRWLGGNAHALAMACDYLKLMPDIFLHLVKMIIAPLVFTTIVVGIANMGDVGELGRIAARAMIWFLIAGVASLAIGMCLANLFQPGAAMLHPGMQHGYGAALSAGEQPSLHGFILKLFPTSAADAMARNDVLQILVFAIFAGVGLSALGQKAEAVTALCEQLVGLMLQITGYVMRFAPLAVFGALGNVVAEHGVGILLSYGRLVAEFYLGLLILWGLLIAVGFGFLRRRVFALLGLIREPFLIAFSTGSSEAALPKLLEQMDRFGVPRPLSGFMLPLGYSFNLDGSMMYTSFATLFVVQTYGIHLAFGTQIAILLTLMVTSKGIASVPRASLLVVTSALAAFGLPADGVALILGIDQVLDMGRTGTNVIGNAIATASIARWEGMLQKGLSE